MRRRPSIRQSKMLFDKKVVDRLLEQLLFIFGILYDGGKYIQLAYISQPTFKSTPMKPVGKIEWTQSRCPAINFLPHLSYPPAVIIIHNNQKQNSVLYIYRSLLFSPLPRSSVHPAVVLRRCPAPSDGQPSSPVSYN